jgi:hypothetical protein
MIRLLLKLTGIFILAYTAVHLGYAKLEKELVSRSCFDIVGLPTPEIPTQGEGKKELQSNKPPLQGLSEEQTSVTGTEEGSGATLAPEVATNDQTVNNDGPPDFQVIIRRNIFQLTQQELPEVVVEEAPTVVEKPTKEVQTALNLTLLGTVMGDNRTSRAIIIEDKKREQKLYQVGDAVQGALIESIERGKVVLDVFGAREILLLKKREGGGPGQSVMSRPPRPPRPSPPVLTPPVLSDPVDIEEEGLEELDDLEAPEEDEKDDVLEEKNIITRRRPPSIPPNRRIGFRRNPIPNAPNIDEEAPIDEPNEDTLPDEQDIPIEE